MLIHPIKRKLSEKIWEKIEVAIIFKILGIFKGLISEKKNIIHSYNLPVQRFANRYFVEHFMGRVSWSKCLEWSLAFRVFIKNQYLWIEVEASEWAEEEGALPFTSNKASIYAGGGLQLTQPIRVVLHLPESARPLYLCFFPSLHRGCTLRRNLWNK